MAEACRCEAAPVEVQSTEPALPGRRQPAGPKPRTRSRKLRGFRWDVEIAGLLPNKSFHMAREAGLPIPCAREAEDSWDVCGGPKWMWLSLALFCKTSQTVMMPFRMVIRLTGWMDICALS